MCYPIWTKGQSIPPKIRWELVEAAKRVETPSKPLNLPSALALGLAAIVKKNPFVTRRFWRLK